MLEKQYQIIIDTHDQRLLRKGSRGHGARYFTHPVGKKLSKKEVKRIAKREKELAEAKMLREDKVEDPTGGITKQADHYLVQEQNYKIDYQKELLCGGHSIRVIFSISV
jgi:hypothetical protein